jgi:tape measure domain-containing protein
MANTIQILITAKDNASDVIAGVNKAVSGSRPSFDEAAAASSRFGIGLLGVATAGAGILGYGAKIAGDLESARMGFITLLGSSKAADDTIAQIKKDAAATPFEVKGLIQANEMLTGVTHNGGQSETILMNVGKALAGMGKGQPELDRIIANLQQIGAVGHASMMDIRQFAFAGIPIFKLLTDETGKTGEALNDMISNGGVTFDMLTDAFAKAGTGSGQFANAFTNQAGTFNQLVSNMHDTLNMTLSDIVTKSGAFDILKGAVAGFTDFMSSHKDAFAGGIIAFMTFVRDNAPYIAGVLGGMLAPALIKMAIGIGNMVIALGPWAIAGLAVAAAAKLILDHFGGLHGLMQAMEKTWQTHRGLIVAVASGFALVGAVLLATALPAIIAWGTSVVVTAVTSAAAFMIAWAPIFLIGAIIGGVAYEVVKHWNAIKNGFFTAINFVKAHWDWFLTVFLGPLGFIIGEVIKHWDDIKRTAIQAFTDIRNWISDVINFIYNFVIKPVLWLIKLEFTILKDVVMYVFDVIRGLAIVAWWFIYNNIVQPVIGFIKMEIQGLINIATFVWNTISAVAMAVWNFLWANIISPVINAIVGGINWLGGIIGGVFNWVAGIASSVGGAIGRAFSSAWGFVVGVWNGVYGFFSGIVNHITGVFSGMGGSISGAFSGAFNGVKGIVTGAINWIIDKVNGVIHTINNTAGKLPGVPKIGDIPHLATGTNFFEGGVALLGEQGPEIVNLPRGASVTPAVSTARELASNQPAPQVNLSIEYNGRGQFSYDDAVSMAGQIVRALKSQGLSLDEMQALR